MTKKKIALFGGTFDPIHIGHTTVACRAAEHIGAERVIFIPAGRSPLKKFSPQANDNDRLQMILLAIAGNKDFEASDYELNRASPSYTLETVRRFQADYGSETTIYWLAGADSIEELSRWYKVTNLIDECNLSVMYRAGCDKPDFSKFEEIWGAERVEKLKQNIIPTPLIDISSTEIRSRLVTGLDVCDMLAPAVAEYIHERNLYRSKTQP